MNKFQDFIIRMMCKLGIWVKLDRRFVDEYEATFGKERMYSNDCFLCHYRDSKGRRLGPIQVHRLANWAWMNHMICYPLYLPSIWLWPCRRKSTVQRSVVINPTLDLYQQLPSSRSYKESVYFTRVHIMKRYLARESETKY